MEGFWWEIRVVYASVLGVGAVKADRSGSTEGIVGCLIDWPSQSLLDVLSDRIRKLEKGRRKGCTRRRGDVAVYECHRQKKSCLSSRCFAASGVSITSSAQPAASEKAE